MNHSTAEDAGDDRGATAIQVLECLRSRLSADDLATIAASQSGPREPVVRELAHALQGECPTMSPATLDAISCSLFGDANRLLPGHALMCYVLLVEDAITHPDHPSSMQMHSGMPLALSDAFTLGKETSRAVADWLYGCLERVRSSRDATDPLAIQSFLQLGLLLVHIWESTHIAKGVLQTFAKERTALDSVYTIVGDAPTSTIFDLDPYMSRRASWVALWRGVVDEHTLIIRRMTDELDVRNPM